MGNPMDSRYWMGRRSQIFLGGGIGETIQLRSVQPCVLVCRYKDTAKAAGGLALPSCTNSAT